MTIAIKDFIENVQLKDVQLRERGVQPEIPADLNEYTTIEQRYTLKKIESFGWNLYFIRRPLFQEPLVVVHNTVNDDIKVITEDGQLEDDKNLVLRIVEYKGDQLRSKQF